jgi:hypothetical protein
VPRHHLVPQFLLRNFANERDQLRARARDDLSSAHLTTVKNACNEIGFYRIEADDLEAWARDGHDPELVEKVLSGLEADAADVVARLIERKIPRAEQDLFHLALFVAVQSTRGWRFRDEVNQTVTLQMRAEMRARPEELARKARTFLRRRGEPSSPQDVAAFIESAYGENGPRLVAPDPVTVQASLGHALQLTPLLAARSPRLYVFEEPSLVLSDAPVVSWAPGEGRAVGIGNAHLIFMPLSRTVALAYGQKAERPVCAGTRIRARQINKLIADDATRWVYEHPDDDLVAKIEVPAERPKWATELLSVKETTRERRELWQHVRR